MSAGGKDEVITFKVGHELAAAMSGVENRSEFIRRAVMAALDGVCPLCAGRGQLTAEQRVHWEMFSRDHEVRKCDECRALHLECRRTDAAQAHEEAG